MVLGKQPDSLDNIKLAKRSSMAAVQNYFCTASCNIYFSLSALGPLNIFPTKKMGDAQTHFIP
jgi:hypothetical protein